VVLEEVDKEIMGQGSEKGHLYSTRRGDGLEKQIEWARLRGIAHIPMMNVL